MDFGKFVACLSEAERNQLSWALTEHERKICRDRLRAGDFDPLNDKERYMLDGELMIDALKSYRDRTGVSLRMAKEVCDYYKHGWIR